MSYISLFLIQGKILVGDLHKSDLVSDDVIRGRQQVFAHNSQLNKGRDTVMVSLYSSCQNASPNMQHVLPGSTRDLAWSWPEVKFWPDLSTSSGIFFDAPWRMEQNAAWIKASILSSKAIHKKTFICQKRLFWCFLFLVAKPLAAEIWRHFLQKNISTVIECFFPGLLPKISSEIMSYFRRNPFFRFFLFSHLFRFSLRWKRGELAGGGLKPLPPACRGKFRHPEVVS